MTDDELWQTDSPVGSGAYKVVDGDCLESVAVEHGHFWQTIWNDAANRDVKRIRKEPNLLRPGDRLTIPPIRAKQNSGEAGNRHRFRRKGVPSQLEVRLEDENGDPICDQPCLIDVGGTPLERQTDAEGKVKVPILPTARRAVILLTDSNQTFELSLGHIDPIDTICGIQGRLHNIGYDLGDEYGEFGANTKDAVSDFQEEYDLDVTGSPDPATRQKLVDVHGS